MTLFSSTVKSFPFPIVDIVLNLQAVHVIQPNTLQINIGGLSLSPASHNARRAVFLSYVFLSIYMTEYYSALVWRLPYVVYFLFAQDKNGYFLSVVKVH